MPRAERRRKARGAARWSPWWLAVPVLGIAAYAAFSATLALLGDDPARAPSGTTRDPSPRPSLAAPPVAAPVPPSGGDAPTVPAAVPAPAAAVVDGAPPPAASDTPAATATPATQRAAADKVRKVKPKAAPHEHITEQDRRALDALVEQAGKNAR